jgi:LemA protein
MKKLWIVLIVVIIGLVAVFASQYNGLMSSSENVDQQWANVESKLQRRFDLIPNLVESVKGAMAQEKAVFQSIADARAKLAGATTDNERVTASGELDGALSRLLVVMENYPELKSIDTVNKLMDELSGTENRISVERDRFNEEVNLFNRKVRRFPTNLIAGMLGFEARTYFEAAEGATEVPSVNLPK